MIQRIQSLYLLFVIVAQLLLSQFNFINFSKEGTPFHLNIHGIYSSDDSFLVEDSKHLLLLIIAIAVAVIAIFLFKNRKLQLRLSKLITFIAFMQIGYVSTSFYQLSEPTISNLELGLSSYLIIVIGIFSVLANKAIKKDDDLIKSVDRIR